MIVLYRSESSPQADAAAEALLELVVEHRVRVLRPGDPGPAGALPAVVEGRRVVGPDGLQAYLDELTAFMAEARLFQTDTCYLDADGRVC